ncbi:MAG: gliding motility-associated C-terminal domain-containing protein [Flavobacteriales bacterium]
MRCLFFVLLTGAAFFAHGQFPCDVSITVTSPTCPDDADGSITVTPNTPGQYTYIWPHDGTLQGPTATGLSVGPYSVQVFDTTGCFSVIDTLVMPPNVPPLGTITTSNISCGGMDDGSITFAVNPGPYTWQWIDDPTNTATTRTGLGPGQYAVVVNGGLCPSFVFAELGNPAVTIGGSFTYCPSAPPNLSTSLWWGFQPDVYLWSTGDTTTSIDVDIGTVGPVELTAIDTGIGCTVTTEVFLTMLDPPTVTFSAPDSLCLRSPGTAIMLSSNADSLVWHWGSNGFSNEPYPTITFDEPEWQPITLQGYDLFGCGSAPIPDSVYVRPRFPAVFFAEQVPCTPGIEVEFSSDADSCAFFVGDRLVLNQCRGFANVDLERYAEYDFTFYSTRPDRCDDTASFHIDVRTVPTAFIPNSFTPNGDNINDTWPGPLDIPDLDYQVQVFNRWGELLWATTNTDEKWDGDNLPMGVYVYQMKMRDPCNPTAEMERRGFVTLFR